MRKYQAHTNPTAGRQNSRTAVIARIPATMASSGMASVGVWAHGQLW